RRQAGRRRARGPAQPRRRHESGRVQGRVRADARERAGRPMSRNVSGQAYALTVLTPIKDGQAAALIAHLDALGEGDASPLSRVPGTHIARWVVIDDVKFQGHGQRHHDKLTAQRLLLSSNFDGDLDVYL